jgi:hypothetical protein
VDSGHRSFPPAGASVPAMSAQLLGPGVATAIRWQHLSNNQTPKIAIQWNIVDGSALVLANCER